MNRQQVVTFALAFAAGALIALAVRSARHDPYAAPAVNAAPVPSEAPAAGHDHRKAAPPADAKPVNTVCAICGMEVDPKLPTAVYQGKVIGFGCKRCPAEFAANPETYGPAALENRVVDE
jgi:YHS domain-containing protein